MMMMMTTMMMMMMMMVVIMMMMMLFTELQLKLYHTPFKVMKKWSDMVLAFSNADPFDGLQ